LRNIHIRHHVSNQPFGRISLRNQGQTLEETLELPELRLGDGVVSQQPLQLLALGNRGLVVEDGVHQFGKSMFVHC